MEALQFIKLTSSKIPAPDQKKLIQTTLTSVNQQPDNNMRDSTKCDSESDSEEFVFLKKKPVTVTRKVLFKHPLDKKPNSPKFKHSALKKMANL